MFGSCRVRYRYAVIEWYDLVDNKRFSIYEFDAMLEDLGIKGGSFLFSYFRIPGKSLDEGLVPLISHQDVLSLLKYVPSYKEIEVYVEKHTMKVVSGKGKGVVIEEIMEDDETGNMDSTSKVDHPSWSSGSLSDYDINLSQDPIDMTKVVKAEQEMQEPVYYNFHPLMYDSDYALDDLLEQLPFLNDELKENVVGVDAPVVVVEEQLERTEHVVDEEIERPMKRKREFKYEDYK
ncbi:hypothetical protein Tco_0051835 [Tanacetum coccineum]